MKIEKEKKQELIISNIDNIESNDEFVVDVLSEINDSIDEKYHKVSEKYSQLEVASFPIQIEQAKEVLSTGKIRKSSLLHKVAGARDLTDIEFAQIIINKALAYENKIATALVKKINLLI